MAILHVLLVVTPRWSVQREGEGTLEKVGGGVVGEFVAYVRTAASS